MFVSTTNPSSAYARIGVQTGVAAASAHQLILMLYDGASLAIATAAGHMQAGRIAEKGMAVSKAVDIIANGLKVSLDQQAGGEMAGRLAALYDYMCARLLHGNLHNDTGALNEVASLMTELKGAWEEIASDPAVLSANKAAA